MSSNYLCRKRWTTFNNSGIYFTDYESNTIRKSAVRFNEMIGRFSIAILLILLHYSEATTHRPPLKPTENPEKFVNNQPNHYVRPLYKFGYSVYDPYTLDIKSQWEHRDGDAVQGSYSFLDADGMVRIVEYTADKDHGFRANVRKVVLHNNNHLHQLTQQPSVVSRHNDHFRDGYYAKDPYYTKEHHYAKEPYHTKDRYTIYRVPVNVREEYNTQHRDRSILPVPAVIYKPPTTGYSLTAADKHRKPIIIHQQQRLNKAAADNAGGSHNNKVADEPTQNDVEGTQRESGYYKQEQKSSKYETKSRSYNEYAATPR